MTDIQDCLGHIAARVRPLASAGRVANYIPGLGEIDPAKFGVAVATLDGTVYVHGDSDELFSIQSISKVFSLVLASKLVGDDLWQRVGRLPSSNQFNSLIDLELNHGKPRNPFVNPGALVIADLLTSRNTQMAQAVVALVRELSGNPALSYDLDVADGEAAFAHRNKAAAHLMKSFGNFNNAVDDVVAAYCAQCAIACSCRDLAVAALFLADGGRHPGTGRQILAPQQVRQVCALMMSSGTYEVSGEIAFSIGLPIKSGVGGGVLAVIPRFGTMCVWSPPLDHSGSSVAGLKAVELFSESMSKTVFA